MWDVVTKLAVDFWTVLPKLAVDFWTVLAEMAPYLLFGFLVAGILAVLIPQEMVERHLGGEGLMPVLKASLFGVPLPLCSCGVIPVAASLKRNGAGNGATTAFLISTPQTGVDSIMVTLSLLGPVYAIFRPVAAFVNGLVGGALVTWLGGETKRAESVPAGQCCEDGTCSEHDEQEGRLRRVFRHGFVTLPKDIGKAMLIGLVISAAISVAVPKDYFAAYLGGSVWAYLVMLIVGIPVYVCATASVPIAAMLIVAGISPGAALVFLMTGPATNMASISTIWKIMGKRTTIVYLLSIAATSIISGILLDIVYRVGGFEAGMLMAHEHGSAAYGYLKDASGVVLLLLLGTAAFHRTTVSSGAPVKVDEEAQVIRIRIKGMTCSHCAESVAKALRCVPGMVSVKVNLEGEMAEVEGKKLDDKVLRKAVEDLGYTVESIERIHSH